MSTEKSLAPTRRRLTDMRPQTPFLEPFIPLDNLYAQLLGHDPDAGGLARTRWPCQQEDSLRGKIPQ